MKAMRVVAILAGLALLLSVPARAETEPESAYGQTPSQTIRHVFQIKQILRINVVEPYAVVSALGTGSLFDNKSSAEFLLEHFNFGWQVVEMAPSLCARERGISPSDARRLMDGMPKQPAKYASCGELDSGPKRSIAQVRTLMHGPVVPFVRVVDTYAFSVDYSDGGGCGLFRFEPGNNRWKLLGGCKGTMTPNVIEDNHVPLAIVCALRIAGYVSGLKCPEKKT
jgi:hypothetical protein